MTLRNNKVGESQIKHPSSEKAHLTQDKVAILRNKENLIEEILSRSNMLKAYNKVMKNKGCAGVDGMGVCDLKEYLKTEWPKIRSNILDGSYKPNNLLNIEIPKANGTKRVLSVPTVLDRLIQQAIMQILQEYVDEQFSDNSYGFRPKRSAHQAIKESKRLLNEGYEYMVDVDLQAYFDTINQDRLMSLLHARIKDQRVKDLMRRYLNVIKGGRGLAQGSPLSPLLANIYLDTLDQELHRRGHKFVRYGDDLKILVKSQKASNRVMISVKSFLAKKLKLVVNESKSFTGKTCKFLGYIISKDRLSVTKENIQSFKEEIRKQTLIRGGRSLETIFKNLKPLINGWYEYFKLQDAKSLFKALDGWIRRRVRACYHAQLKNGLTRLTEFIKRGISYSRAYKSAYSSRGPWHNSRGDVIQQVLNNNRLKGLGLVTLTR